MKGVVSWADHIQAMGFTLPHPMEFLEQPEKTLQTDKILADENSMFAR